jgi:tRNA threonylcarbamoyladenosine biosynthesis protein TsaB
MAIILHIDSAVETASVCLADNGKPLGIKTNGMRSDHAAWMHVAIKELLDENKKMPGDLDAVAITAGPGSFTGLRISMAAAKGICYALNKPLICLNTLEVMASAARNENTDLLCPMIDARRMEVFTAIYNKDLEEIQPPQAMLLNKDSFAGLLKNQRVCFFGNGSVKFKDMMVAGDNALFSEVSYNTASMITLAEKKFSGGELADLAYAEPVYLKEFYTTAQR